MTDAIWPTPNPAADRLLSRYLDRTIFGWRARAMVDLSGDEVAELLWPLAGPAAAAAGPVTQLQEIALDHAIVRMAAGDEVTFDRLAPGAQNAFFGRLLTAMAAAMASTLTPGPVMRLPHGLTEDQRRLGVAIRVLYQGSPSVEGLG